MYIYIYICICILTYFTTSVFYVYLNDTVHTATTPVLFEGVDPYGQSSKFHVCFCGLDAGNLKFETVRTNEQHICF